MSDWSKFHCQNYINPAHKSGAVYGDDLKQILSLEGFRKARQVITKWPEYRVTSLYSLDGLAKDAGVKSIWYKDEGTRFGLGSFKGLGGAYAVYRALEQEIMTKTGADEVTGHDLLSGKYKDIVSKVTVTCATAGNHGRSVAWGAQLFGAGCVIYIHSEVSEDREKAIAKYGAKMVRTGGNYDDSVRQAQSDATKNGWIVISDTSYEGYMDIPRNVMQGYSVMVDEAISQLPANEKPTHVFLQGGVGGMAAAVTAHLWELWGKDCPKIIIVEPENAACLYQSAMAGKPVIVEGGLNTMMVCLACGEVSLLAWDILKTAVIAFMTIPDVAAMEGMRKLADGVGGDTPVVAGESGVAGFAGLMLAAKNTEVSKQLGLGADSRILLFGTEGETDPVRYRKIVGKSAEEVATGTLKAEMICG